MTFVFVFLIVIAIIQLVNFINALGEDEGFIAFFTLVFLVMSIVAAFHVRQYTSKMEMELLKAQSLNEVYLEKLIGGINE